MHNRVTFTHFVTGKNVVIVDKTSVSAIFSGDLVGPDNKNYPGVVWIMLENVRDPIPVKESEEAVLAALDHQPQ